MQSPSTSSKLAQLADRLEEIRRKTLSSLAVSAGGISYLHIQNGQVAMYGNDGGAFMFNAFPGRWGYENPWSNYVLFPFLQQNPDSADFTIMSDTVVAVIRPNQPKLKVTTGTKVQGALTGRIAETQAVYQVDGGAPVLIPQSVFATSSTTGVSNEWDYLWPGDYWHNKITLHFQARIQPGAGFNRALHGPTQIYGIPA